MTAPVTISGLSGIDTTTVINETLAAAAAPQQAEQAQLNNLQTTDTAYQSINSAMAALKTAADAVRDVGTWQSTTATSSDSSIVATGSTSALAGTATSFSVTALATAQTSTISLADSANAANAGIGIDITIGTGSAATTSHITPASNSAADLVTAVNAANIGVKAALITTTTGTILQFASTATGTANSFTVSGLTAGSTNGTPNELSNLSTAADAAITVGSGAGSYSIDSSTNTFANAIPGVTFTVSALTTSPATISVTSDPTVASTAVQNLVTAANAALGLIAANTGQGDLLEGDSLATTLTAQILSAVSTGSSANGSSFTLAGVDINTNGQLTFDSTAFAAGYTAGAVITQSLVSNLSTALSGIGDEASNTATGSITQALSSNSSQEANLTSEIADWNTKLADQKTALTNKFAAMDAALSKLQSEQSFLASAFGGSSSSTSSGSGLSQASVSGS